MLRLRIGFELHSVFYLFSSDTVYTHEYYVLRFEKTVYRLIQLQIRQG
jgi:hypothetical protein